MFASVKNIDTAVYVRVTYVMIWYTSTIIVWVKYICNVTVTGLVILRHGGLYYAMGPMVLGDSFIYE